MSSLSQPRSTRCTICNCYMPVTGSTWIYAGGQRIAACIGCKPARFAARAVKRRVAKALRAERKVTT